MYQVLIIDVKEPKELVQSKLQDKFNFSFPLLLDLDGAVAASFAPQGVLPDLARDEVMLASNLLIDPDGKIQFIINTTEGKQAIADSFSIRREALQRKVSYTTTIAGGRATLRALDHENDYTVHSLQQLHRGLEA